MARRSLAVLTVFVTVAALFALSGPPPQAAAATTDGEEDVFAFGAAGFHGSTGNLDLARAVVGMAPTPTGEGYWEVASDGGVFAFGDAAYHGSTGDIRLNQPIVAMAASPSGDGYWLAASDGGIFTFGDAGFHGSTGDMRLNQPIVAMAATPSGDGYWLAASDGGIFTFGDAGFHGSTADLTLNRPIVSVAAAPEGAGYWLAASDGGIFTFGDARFHGSSAGRVPHRSIVGMAATPPGDGYWLVTSGECVFRGGTERRASAPQSHVMLLNDVRTGAHDCYERVVFDFRDEQGAADGAIDYEVSYRRPPFVDASGTAVDVDGSAHLSVLFRGGRAHRSEDGRRTYDGPTEIKPDNVSFVRELEQIQDYEATLEWVIGLDQRRVFNVIELDGPDRIAIDIGPPAASGDVVTAHVHFTPESSLDRTCGETQPVVRTVAAAHPLTETMQELLAGPTAAERNRGLTSWFSSATAGMLRSASVVDGTARVDFGDLREVIPNASSSCGSTMLLAQLDRTATQFAGVERTRYSLEGDVDAFYEWLQRRPPGHS